MVGPPPLAARLPTPLTSLRDAGDRAAASLAFLAAQRPRVIATINPYVLQDTTIDGTRFLLRPVNRELFIVNEGAFREAFDEFLRLLDELRRSGPPPAPRAAAIRGSLLISRVLYTTLQAMGCAMDCLLLGQQARKNYGMRFEELTGDVLSALGIAQAGMQFRLPYTDPAGGTSYFINEVDRVVSQRPAVASTRERLEPDEVVLSIKTSSKDRFAKVFLDQEMLSYVLGRPVKVVALFHNDIQRSGETRVSVTFVAGNFAAYVARFGPLTGVYYVDPPPHINRPPWSNLLRRYEDLLLEDLWTRIF